MMRLAAWLLVWLLWPGLAAATDGPRPPCDGPPRPQWPAAGELPRVQIWQTDELRPRWLPPDCLGWPADDVTRLVALAGRFAHAGDGDALLARFAAVSGLRGITYWSDREERWEELVLEAAALTSPDPAQRRDDFSLSELKTGTAHYFLQRDNRSSGIPMYRLRVLQRAPDRIVLNIANVSDVSYWRIPLFPPEALQSSYLLQRLGPGEWGYFSLSGSREPGMAFLLDRPASFKNRAVALFRHVADVPETAVPRFNHADGTEAENP